MLGEKRQMACKPVSLRDTLYKKRKKQSGFSRWRCEACYVAPEAEACKPVKSLGIREQRNEAGKISRRPRAVKPPKKDGMYTGSSKNNFGKNGKMQ